MKIVFASTPGQEDEIDDLIKYFYSGILPRYFSDGEIKEFQRLGVLHTKSSQDAYGTLRDAFYVMASLQTLISILESPKPSDQHRALFLKNADNLRYYGLLFPFGYDSFLPVQKRGDSFLSVFAPAANQLLV
ncbi:YhcU family protein [Neobacillus sp. YIM B06451]|uniref:YhcU family protein n=1 Tax=Neobacillus sp. YIM B06451 TaxID=3070994 RepID=UPI00293193D9|nr:YhcU family protein [Neobacillus sp. YIM B06451]